MCIYERRDKKRSSVVSFMLYAGVTSRYELIDHTITQFRGNKIPIVPVFIVMCLHYNKQHKTLILMCFAF